MTEAGNQVNNQVSIPEYAMVREPVVAIIAALPRHQFQATPK
jgi:hypothetical protein